MSTSILCCVFIIVVGLRCTDADEDGAFIKIPMVRMESGLEKLLRQGADIKLIEGLYNMCVEKAHPILLGENGKPIPSNDTLNLFKYFQTEFYGIINIGKPGRQFKMVIDTSWSFSWVPSYDCPRTSLPCSVHERYNHLQSSTYKPDGRQFNISNRYLGYFSNDVFHAGHLNASNQVFAELTKMPFIYTLYETDGLLGMGFKELAPGYVPFFDNFVQQNNLKKIFSFYINRDPTTTRGGSLFIGGIDFSHNKSAFHPVDITPGSPYWQFDMQKVTVVMSKVKKLDLCNGGCVAIADTSSNTIIGPADDIKQINLLIGAERLFFSDRYMIPCVNEYKGAKISFTIANKEFTIKAQDYIQKLSYSGVQICLSAFQPAKPGIFPPKFWSLGGAFLYRYYTAFDVGNRQLMIADVS